MDIIKISTYKNWSGLLFHFLIGDFIFIMLSLGKVTTTFELIFFCLFVSFIFTKAGVLALEACHLISIKAWLPTSFIVGFAMISSFILALTIIFGLSAFASFWVCGFVVMGLCVFKKETLKRPSNSWTDTLIVLVFSILIGCLSKTPISSSTASFTTGILENWSDYFLHGITISSFGSPYATGGELEMAGVSHVFYHYAPFMIPAVFQSVTEMSGFELSTLLLLPLGLLIGALGSYAFAVEIGGRVAGLLSVVLIICMPAYSFLIQSGWFDFYWLLFIAPGSGYALGVSGVVCASTFYYLKNKNNGVLWFTVLLLFSLVLIRVHLFMLLAPAIVALLLLDRWRVNVCQLLGILVCTIAILLVIFNLSSYLHSLWMKYANPYVYLNVVLQWLPIYGFPIKFQDYPLGLTLFTQIVVVLMSVLGVYFGFYPIMLWMSIRRFGFHLIDSLPLVLIFSFIVLMLFAPSSSVGDITDYKHRHFLLLYVIIAIYTISYSYSLVSNYVSNENLLDQSIYGLVICIFTASIILNWNSNPIRPNIKAMPWVSSVYNKPLTPGLLEVAQYLRAHTQYGDVLAMGVAAANELRSPVVSIISLTGIPAYLARSELKMMRSQCVKKIAEERLSVLHELSAIDNWNYARKFIQSKGIRWFLVLSGEKQKWDPNQEFSVFSSKDITVYDVGHFKNEVFKHEC